MQIFGIGLLFLGIVWDSGIHQSTHAPMRILWRRCPGLHPPGCGDFRSASHLMLESKLPARDERISTGGGSNLRFFRIARFSGIHGQPRAT